MPLRRRPVLCALTLLVPALASLAFDDPLAGPIAVFVTVVALWFTELLPLPVTGLLVPVLIALYGIQPVREAFAPFGNDILFLFLGAFFLARAMHKHQWDKRMSYWVLATRLGGSRPAMLIAVVAGMSFVLSMWISNTAACAILVPVCIGILAVVEEQAISPDDLRRLSTRLLLACAFASTMGGIATPIGTPPNLIALQFLRDRGIVIPFHRWIAIGLPLALLLFGLMLFLLARRYPVPRASLGDVRASFRARLAALGPLRRDEVGVAVVFGLTVLLWTGPGILTEILPPGSALCAALAPLSLSVVALGAAVVLFVVPGASGRPLLEWSDAREIDWGTIVLFGGGITLGGMLESSGLAAAFGRLIFSDVSGSLAMIAIGVALAVAMSEFASNTASAAVVIPILVAATAAELAVQPVVLAAAFAASFGFMLPVSTPPNAIVYGTGRVELREMVRTGVVFDVLGAATVVLYLTGLTAIGLFG